MQQGLMMILVTIAGLASMGAIAFLVVKIMINTTKYDNKKNNRK